MPNGSWHYEFMSLSFYRGSARTTTSQGRLFSRQESRQAAEFTRTFWWEIGRFCAAASKPSEDHQGQAIVLLHADHQWQKNLFKDPEVLLAAELGSWPWRLQEQAHGASTRAQSWWGAQSGRWQSLHQLDDVESDGSNKTEAARQVEASSKPTSVPMLGMLFPRLPFLVGSAIPHRRLILFHWEREMGPREKLAKIKFCFIRGLHTLSETCLQWMFWETSPNG